MKNEYETAKRNLHKKYMRWMDEAINLANDEGLFIGAAFAQIAFEERKKEIQKEALEKRKSKT